jgi:hypothetical protein
VPIREDLLSIIARQQLASQDHQIDHDFQVAAFEDRDGSAALSPRDADEPSLNADLLADETADLMDLDNAEPWYDIDQFEQESEEPRQRRDSESIMDSAVSDSDTEAKLEEYEDEEEEEAQLAVNEQLAEEEEDDDEELAEEEEDDEAEEDKEGEVDEDKVDAQLQRQLHEAIVPQIDYASELGHQLIRFNSCSYTEHQQQTVQHEASSLNPSHYSLEDFQQLLYTSHCPILIDKRHLLTANERKGQPQPDWQRIFEGTSTTMEDADSGEQTDYDLTDSESGANRHPRTPELCLKCSQYNDPPSAKILYDIDSFLGYATSLAFARQGITINLYPRYHTNIRTNLHLYTTVFHDYGKGPKAMRVKLHRVPHYCLGRVLGHEDISVYVFFPGMFDPEKPTNFPGKGAGEPHGLLRSWTDHVLLPALFRHVSPSTRQHLPSSWEHARRKAEARYAQNRGQVGPDQAEPRALSLHYPLHASSLEAIWTDVEEQLHDPANTLYRGAQLFFSSKNTKMQHPYYTLASTWQAFTSALASTLNFDYLDRAKVWIDLGKETVCPDYALPKERLGHDSQPATYLMRACCQQSFARWAELGESSSSL